MRDFLLALAFIAMLLVPAMVATRSSSGAGKKDS